MDNISMEKKLELVHQVRSQYQKNQYDLMSRENLLYGKTSRPLEYSGDKFISGENQKKSADEEGLFRDGTVKIRYAIAAVLLLIIILMDQSGKSIAGVSVEQLFQMLEADYGDTIAAWVEDNVDTDVP